MNILLAGGGSGGHVTPLRAISEALVSETDDELEITVVTDRGFYAATKTVFADQPDVKLKKVLSGKYRRYQGKSFLWHVLHLPTLFKNIIDIFLLGLGIIQASYYFLVHRPDVVFCKGGFVCVPIGMATRLFRVPLIIHDSDTRPGLTNRILARWALKIATGMPASFYPYPKSKMVYVGIPVKAEYQPVTEVEQRGYKQSLRLDVSRPTLLVTGGGNGSTPLNKQVVAAASQLINAGWSILHIAGTGKAITVYQARDELGEDQQAYWQIEEFTPMLPRLLAADVIVTRTSATTLQECANAEKAVIGIASPLLEDQKMNAEYFASKEAIIEVDETTLDADGSDLVQVISTVSPGTTRAKILATTLHKNFAKPNAAAVLAKLIMAAKTTSSHQ